MDSNNQKIEELLRRMYAQKESFIDEDRLEQTIDEEWEKFVLKHAEKFEGETKQFGPKRRLWNWTKIAAMFVGVLILSGITYAAVYMVRSSLEKKVPTQTEETRMADSSRQREQMGQTGQREQQDHTTSKPVLFENAELQKILSEMGAYYHYEVMYQNKDARHIRLYFTWDKQQSIDEVIETFNRFERIHIKRENQKLIVE